MSIPESIAGPLYEAFAEGDADEADEPTEAALAAGVDPLEIISDIMIPALTDVGASFQTGECFLPELMMSGEAAEVAGKPLEAAIAASGQSSQKLGVVVLGTVEGDVHDIGKNIVSTMLRAHGFEVIDLGRNVSPSAFVDAAKERKADVVGLSSLMTTTRPAAQSTINLFRELDLLDTYSLMVGGGCVTADWADAMGVNYSPDAAGAVELCKQLVG